MTPCPGSGGEQWSTRNGSAVDTLIVDGKVLMRDRKVPGEGAGDERGKRVARQRLFNVVKNK